MDKTLKIDEAIKSLKLAIKYNPQSARALNYLGYIYADNSIDIDESLNLIKKAIDLEPSNGAFIDSLGWAYFRKGNYKMALENLLNAQDILGKAKMDDPVVFDHIGDTYLRLGKKKDAVFYWNKSIMLKTDEKIRQKIKQTEK
jgi:tetratricopeptide (TPR) repeat protein